MFEYSLVLFVYALFLLFCGVVLFCLIVAVAFVVVVLLHFCYCSFLLNGIRQYAAVLQELCLSSRFFVVPWQFHTAVHKIYGNLKPSFC